MEQQTIPTLKPAKYEWDADAKFIMDGNEFTQVFNSLNNYINSREFQAKLQEVNVIMGCYKVMENKLSIAVAAGTAREMKEDNLVSEAMTSEVMNPKKSKKHTTPSQAIEEAQIVGN